MVAYFFLVVLPCSLATEKTIENFLRLSKKISFIFHFPLNPLFFKAFKASIFFR